MNTWMIERREWLTEEEDEGESDCQGDMYDKSSQEEEHRDPAALLFLPLAVDRESFVSRERGGPLCDIWRFGRKGSKGFAWVWQYGWWKKDGPPFFVNYHFPRQASAGGKGG